MSDINVLFDDTETINVNFSEEGKIDVYFDGQYIPGALGDLTNVNITSPVTGEILMFNGTAWVNEDENDPVFTASPAFGIASGDIANWNTAYGWGNHASEGYLKNITGLISDGSNVTITGTGTSGDPYVISASGGGGGGGSGTVTSVGLSVPTGLSVSGSPITESGTLAISYASGYQGYTSSEASKLSGIEAGADITDATNVAAAGAIMDSDISANGMMVRTSSGAYTSRTITGTSNQITVTNGNGVSGNPTLALHSNITSAVSLANSALQAGDNISELTNNSGFITNLSSFDTDDLSEGSTNKYNVTHTGDATGSGSLSVVALRGVALDATVGSPTDGKILVYRSAGSDWVLEDKPTSSGNPAWGDITGTLSAQTDLKNALDAKYDASNPNGYTTNTGTVTSVSTGTGLTGGTITGTGTISLNSSSIASLSLADTAVQNLGDLGITASSSELNILDGVTATTAELNYVDGVTSAIQTQLNAKAADSDVVKLTGNQSVEGVKTFSSFPVTPSSAPTTDYEVANKKYVDDNVGGGDHGMAALAPIEVSVATGASTMAKVGTTSGGSYSPTTGDVLLVAFSSSNTSSNPTLNVDGSGAKSILVGGNNPSNIAMAGTKVLMWYDGTAYQLFGSQRNSDSNTTYTGITGGTTTTTTATATLTINNYRIANYASGQLGFTLPSTAAVGSIIEVYGMSAGGYRITAPSGDNIIMENGADSGAAGYIEMNQYGWVQLRCIVANTTWVITDSNGIVENNNGVRTGLNRYFINTSQSSITPESAKNDIYQLTALATGFTLNSPTMSQGSKIVIYLGAISSNRTFTAHSNYKFAEDNPAPANIELGWTYEFVITKDNYYHYVSWTRYDVS